MKRLLSLLLTFLLAGAPAFASSFADITIKPSTKATYMASTAFGAPPAATTDHFQLYGSGSKTITIEKLEVAYTGGGNNVIPTKCFLIKRSTANSGGTATTLTAVPLDSTSAAATAVAKVYTANPTTGSSVGQISSSLLNVNPLLSGANPPPRIVLYDARLASRPIILRGTSEGLVANFNGVIPDCPAPSLSYTITWTEE